MPREARSHPGAKVTGEQGQYGVWFVEAQGGQWGEAEKKMGTLPRGPAALLKLRFHPIPSPSQ